MDERRQDFELLRAFARRADQGAFTAVVRRHLDLVFATALRKVGDPAAAEEVAQDVFKALAAVAWRFAPDDSVPAWLYQTALNKSRFWLRGELRRRRREQTAAELGTTMKTPDEQLALRALVPLLDEALLSLRDKDRTALLLRFYENQSLRDVGVSLGIGEDAAQKRVGGALEKLSRFFQRRGFKTASVAATTAALQHTASAAPAAIAISVVQAAQQLAPPAALLSGLLSRIAGLTRLQTATACIVAAAVPVVWQLNQAHRAWKAVSQAELNVDDARIQREEMSAEIARLRADSSRLDAALTGSAEARVRAENATRTLEGWKARLNGLLNDPNYRWPDDLPYVRLPKALIKDELLKLREKHPGGAGQDYLPLFGPSGSMTDIALELLGVGSGEKEQIEPALSKYWSGVLDLTASRAYETNSSASVSGRVTKTVIVPPLGSDLEDLAAGTREQIAQQLGDEREKMLFGGWDEGAIQIFWPGNLVKIADASQEFTVWWDPSAAAAGRPAYGARWVCGGPSVATDGDTALSVFPRDVATRYFIPWLQQAGFTVPDSIRYFGDPQ